MIRRSDQTKLIKESNDIVDVVSSYVALQPQGGTYKGVCPFHDDNRPSFDVDPRRQRYRCWSCGVFGDVISFVQEHERVSFPEALELLARRAGISLDQQSEAQEEQYRERAQLLDVMAWAQQQYHQCLLDEAIGEGARQYLGSRHLLGPTVRKFGVGFAPPQGEWLAQRAKKENIPFERLIELGLIAKRSQGQGFYDRFRDRVLFPICDNMGRPIGFGGRILPSSPLADRGPKYYNSPDTPLFNKREVLYGLDQARNAATKAGYLAVVEGYTDVLMAHQCGIEQIVATMGTALTGRHVRHLRRFVPRVVLVFDADIGGSTGVDRALELFASQEVDLAIATLPQDQDPCDLLSQPNGTDLFHHCLNGAVDALDFKLERILNHESASGIEGSRRAVDAVLGIIALAPELPGQAGAVKRELMVSRISRRLALKEETIWARLDELRQQKARRAEKREERPSALEVGEDRHQAPSAPEERQLLEVLLAEPDLVSMASQAVKAEEIQHPGLRMLLEGLYALQAAGEPPTLDQLRPRLNNPRLAEWAMKQQDLARSTSVNRSAWLEQIVAAFRHRRAKAEKKELHNQLHAVQDHSSARELLQRLQNNK